MARIEKTVFISYRRADVYTALAVYENLKNQDYDVFFDYRSISSGDFEQIITSNIRARAHFLLILTPTALDRMNEPGDWLRREIEIAIDEKRNIIPLFFRGFRFGDPSVTDKLTGKLLNLSHYNGLNVHEDYFDEAMQRVRTQFLSKPLNTVLHPVSTQVRKVVREEQIAADEALEQIEDVQQLVKKAEEKPIRKREPSKPIATQAVKSETAQRVPGKTIPRRLIAVITGGVLVIVLFILGGISIWNSLSNSTPEPTLTSQSTPPTPALGISTMTGNDGMTLLYVPAGEFTMGSNADDALVECQKFISNCQRDWFIDEEPLHKVDLDAFWIDQTEVKVRMYYLCVEADVCEEPTDRSSYTRSSYYGNGDFDNYPVIYVNWNMAKTYCEWADRRLPTEAEWEKAARGTDANVYPWGNDAPNNNLLNYYNSAIGDTTEVGKYPAGASPYGALDMAGNVWEWVDDWYDAYPGNTDRLSSYGTSRRVLRGGSWDYIYNVVRSAVRYGNGPTNSDDGIGFRCSRSP
jgi:formylglycine-generating enzyme required for sulfatase activity